MMIWLLKTVLSKAIGLDQIPKEKRDAAAKLAASMAEKGVEAFARGAAAGMVEGYKYEITKGDS